MEWKVYESLFIEEANKKIEWIESEFNKVRTGRANPSILDSIRVDYYGTPSRLIEFSNISIPDARTIIIKPYEKNMINEIASAISKANLGFNPLVDADCVRITFPAPTEESRKQSVKKIKETLEAGKVQIRNVRKEILDKIKKDDELREDELKIFEKKVDDLTKKFNSDLDIIFNKKEKELMTI